MLKVSEIDPVLGKKISFPNRSRSHGLSVTSPYVLPFGYWRLLIAYDDKPGSCNYEHESYMRNSRNVMVCFKPCKLFILLSN